MVYSMATRRCVCRCFNLRTSFRTGHHRQYSVAPSAVGFDNYESEKKNFRLVTPEYYNFATDVIDKWAKKEADVKKTPAFWWSDEKKNTIKWSFSDLSEMSKRTANMLTGPCGLNREDRVLVILPKVPEWWLLSLGCIRAGIVQIPGTTQLTTRDIKLRLQRSCAKAIIVDDTHIDGVDEIVRECPDLKTKLVVSSSSSPTRKGWLNWKTAYNSVGPNFEAIWTKARDPMMIFFTSGTTGAPKMAEHSNASYGLGHTITAKYWLDLTPNDVFWSISDTGWAKAAYSNIFSPWLMGSCVFIHHSVHKFDPEDGLKILAENPVDVFCAPPTGYRMMVQQNLSSYNGIQNVRHYVSAGEPLNPEVSEFWEDKTGAVIREGYGQTETVLTCATFRCIENRRGSMGKPLPGMPVLIVDDYGHEVPKGIEGNIAVRIKPHRPLGLFTRYVDEPQRTEKTFKGEFYLTGDRAYKDEDGYYWFVSRDDDVITSAGYRIGPFEVESALIEHPAVAESAVVSSPDPIRGAIVKAFVVLTKEFEDKNKAELIKELQYHVRKVTAPYKYPRKIEFVEELPKTVSGKIRRVELRHREWQAQLEEMNTDFTKVF